jgi:ribosomal protein L40E
VVGLMSANSWKEAHMHAASSHAASVHECKQCLALVAKAGTSCRRSPGSDM